MGVGGKCHTPATPTAQERSRTHLIGSWLSPRASLDGCGKSHTPNGIRALDLPGHSQSPYQLRCPSPQLIMCCHLMSTKDLCKEMCEIREVND